MTATKNDKFCDPPRSVPHPPSAKMKNRSFVFKKKNLQTCDKF